MDGTAGRRGLSTLEDAIDHQLTLDPGGRNGRALYDAARHRVGGPLVGRAADCLHDAIEPGAVVAIATGFPIPPSNRPETDGPPGAAVFARAVDRLGGQPVFVVDERTEPVVDALAGVLGVDAAVERPPSTPGGLLDHLDPAAVVAIETPGRSADGTYRTMTGEDITPLVTPVDDLVAEAADRGVSTIGVGDGGNEVGMGAIRSAVGTHIESGETIASTTETGSLVVAGVSNWGAYGLNAALAARTDRSLCHTPAVEGRLLEVAVGAGAVDGVTGRSTPSVDGIGRPVHERVVGVLDALSRSTRE